MKVRIPSETGPVEVELEWLKPENMTGHYIGKTSEDKEKMLNVNISTLYPSEFPGFVKCFMGVFEVIE